jgi:hypothetical protein
MSRDSSVTVPIAGNGIDDGIRFPAEAKNFIFATASRLAPIQWGLGDFPKDKAAEA